MKYRWDTKKDIICAAVKPYSKEDAHKEMALTKNETIKATLKATREKRQHLTCNVFEVKLDRPHLNHDTEEQLKRLFMEEKWLYNYILSQPNVFEMDYKLCVVPVNGIDRIPYVTARLVDEAGSLTALA